MTPNQSHGHVTPNADGYLARCGGPKICKVCLAELDRLRAKASQGGEAVAWLNVATGCVTTLPVVVMDWDDEGEEVQSLYTHPADQVAEPDVELVELLRSKFPRIDPCQPVPLDEKAHCCEYTIYVERERLHRMIDAKLASLKGVEE